MARNEARLQFGIWQKGLGGLSRDAKLLYAVLLTEPTVNYAGVGAIRIDRWADEASMSMDDVEKALAELGREPQVVVDNGTHEVLVRTLIRNDGIADQPYVLKGALKDALRTVSPMLRRVLAAELRRLPPRKPDAVSKSGRPVIYPDPHGVADLLDPEDPPGRYEKGLERVSGTVLGAEGSPKGFEKGFERVTEPFGEPLDTRPTWEDASGERVSEGSPDGLPEKGFPKGLETLGGGGWGGGRGSCTVTTQVQRSKDNDGPVDHLTPDRARDDQRHEADEIPDDWAPHARHRVLAAQRGLNVDHEAAQFRAHALDKGRISKNWHAAFDSWLGRAGVDHGARLRVVNGSTEPHRDPKTGRAVEW